MATRYYFNVRRGEEFIADSHGDELPDLAAAKAEAVLILAEMIYVARLCFKSNLAIEVGDDTGTQLLMIKATFEIIEL